MHQPVLLTSTKHLGMVLTRHVFLCCCRYELAYIESREAGVARGQRVWQLAFGSGFKFNSCVLVANKRVQETHTAWKGFDSQVRAADTQAGVQHCILQQDAAYTCCMLARSQVAA